ncbi:MAG: hypothetical protein JW820_16450, partial [Spirochaetales bacterium]|nr:hypothetical protein [Spirochaetales bacterium]
TVARSREFDTPIGRFTFDRVPVSDPRAGVQGVRLAHDAWAFVASPLRAIADLVYLRPSVTWVRDGVGFLTESLRIEGEDLGQIDLSGSREIQDTLSSRRVREYLDGLRRELTR